MSSTSAALTSIQELSAEDCAAATRWSKAAIFSLTEDWPNAREQARRLIPRLTRTAAARGRRIVNSLILGSFRRGTVRRQAVLYKARPRTPGKNTVVGQFELPSLLLTLFSANITFWKRFLFKTCGAAALVRV